MVARGAFPLAALAGSLLARDAMPAEPWLYRPLVLPTLGFSADVGFGVGQATLIDPAPPVDPSQLDCFQPRPTGVQTPVGTSEVGTGLSIEAALGLPRGFEVGARIGVRFGTSGALTTADGYGRLFDPTTLHTDPGTYSLANPEFRIRELLFDAPVATGGFEVRLIPGFAVASANILVPGVPLRFRVPGVARIDTGVEVPVSFANGNTWGLELPLAVWFQGDDVFFGPLTGFFVNNPSSGLEYGGNPNQIDIHAGLGVGYTVGGIWDLKAQILTLHANGADWARYVGGGLDVGLVVP